VYYRGILNQQYVQPRYFTVCRESRHYSQWWRCTTTICR